jgi:hypothetical protein
MNHEIRWNQVPYAAVALGNGCKLKESVCTLVC